MSKAKSRPEFYAPTRKAWRDWLRTNGDKAERVWLIIYKKDSGVPTVTYPEAVEEALCFGWIDATGNKRDEQSYHQLFAPRKPKSNWSKINKERVERLVAQKKMTKRGLALIEEARRNGAWNALDDVSEGLVPADLQQALDANPSAKAYFNAFPFSTRRALLEWIGNAKTEATRNKRIDETVRLAAVNERANQWRPKK